MSAEFILAILGFMGAGLALGLGLDSMTHGGESNLRHGGHYMAARIGFQAAALLAILIPLLVNHF